MDFDYIDLYYDIVSKKSIIVIKEYFNYFEKEILYFISMNNREKEKYINDNKRKFKYIDDSKKIYYDSIKLAANLYKNIILFKNFDEKFKNCDNDEELELINEFSNNYNGPDVSKLIEYSLVNKYKAVVKKEASKSACNDKYLEGYLKHFPRKYSINISFDTFNYIERHGNEIFKDIIDGLMTGELLDIFSSDERYVDIVLDYCKSFMEKDKFLKDSFKDIKKGILEFSIKAKDTTYQFEDIKNVEQEIKNYQFISLISHADDIINRLVTGKNHSIKEFCEKENIDSNNFRKLVDYLKENNQILYNTYKNYRDHLQTKRYKSLVIYAKNVVEAIENGITLVDGTIRDFDNFDYVLMCNMDLSSFRRIVDSSELKKLTSLKYKVFCRKYLNRISILTNLERLKKEKKVIANHEVTDDEKEEIVSFFKKNSIPLEEGLVAIATRRKITENIDFNNYIMNNLFSDMLEQNKYEDINLDGTDKKYVKK